MSLAPIDEALRRIRRGEMVLVVDDEDRENEGDLQMAGSWVTPEAINFMLRWARGLICMPAAAHVLEGLKIGPMVPPGEASCDTAFMVPIDHVDAGSGIGAADRALTIRRVVAPDAVPGEFLRSGHVLPLCSRPGGVLERRGHTETAVDREVLADDGSPARLPDLCEFASVHRVAMVSVEQVVQYRLDNAAQTRNRTVATLLL